MSRKIEKSAFAVSYLAQREVTKGLGVHIRKWIGSIEEIKSRSVIDF